MVTRLRRNGAAVAVLELVHPGYFNALPPSPWEIACRAAHAGIATIDEVVWHELVINKRSGPLRAV